MPIEADLLYKTKDQIVSSMIASLQARLPDAHIEEDGGWRLLFEVVAGEIEGVGLMAQILRDNIFVQRADIVELRLHGEEFGLALKQGTPASGTVRLSGDGGTFIAAGASVASDPGSGDVLYYDTTADATIPNPGDPTAPTLADGGAGGTRAAGLWEGVVTFMTAAGETLASPESVAVSIVVNHKVNFSAIPLGGPGTTGRKLYLSFNGGAYGLVHTIADNTTTTWTDDGTALGAAPPAVSSAEAILVAAQAEEIGSEYNAITGAINEVAEVPDGVTDVTNLAPFTGGTDEEDMEAYRARLLDFIRNPKTGSPGDLETWAEEIEGVAQATAFPNDNLGTPTSGHVTVRIIGPDGTIPSAGVIAAVQAFLDSQDIANMTIHVATFTAVPVNVTVDVTTDASTTLADATPNVQQAISDYLNGLDVGATVYRAGIIEVVMQVAGVIDVAVSVPATNTTMTATQKATAGVISVT